MAIGERAQSRRKVSQYLARAAASVAAYRAFGGAAIASAAPAPLPAHAERGVLRLHDTTIADRRLLALTPSWGQTAAPLVVLLHGLGETGDARTGAYAWWERYGLQSSYARLFDYPIAATTKLGYFLPSRIADINVQMLAEPMRPLAFLSKPYASAAAVGSLMIRKTSRPAIFPASLVACRCASLK